MTDDQVAKKGGQFSPRTRRNTAVPVDSPDKRKRLTGFGKLDVREIHL
jgi:hypothetical protein